MANKSAQKAYEAYKKSQKKQQKAVNKKAKKNGSKPKKVAGSNYDRVRKKTETAGKQGADNRKSARTQAKNAVSKVGSAVKSNTNKTTSRSGAVTPVNSRGNDRRSASSTARSALGSGNKPKATNFVKAQGGTAKGSAAAAYNQYKTEKTNREDKYKVTVKNEPQSVIDRRVAAEQSHYLQEQRREASKYYDKTEKEANKVGQTLGNKDEFIDKYMEDDSHKKALRQMKKQANEENKYSYTKALADSNEFFMRANASNYANTKVKTETNKPVYQTDENGNIKYDKNGKPKVKRDKNGNVVHQKIASTQGNNILDYYGGGFDKNGRLKNQNASTQLGNQTAGFLRDSKFAAGMMQGLSYSDITSGLGNYSTAAAKDVQKTKESGAFNIGYMAGQAGQFMLGGTNKMTDALVKGITKAGAKRSALNIALRKGGADALFEAPLNTLDAIKMATDSEGNFDKKAFATYMALNSGLSGGMGGAIGGIGAKMTQKNAKEYLTLAAKINVGTKLSDDEMLKFTKLQNKFESARQGNDVAKADIINRADYDARVHDEVFSRGGNSVDAEAAMNGATTHSEKMSYARTIKDTAEQEFDALRTQREQLVSKLNNASPEEAVGIRKDLAANRRELDRLGGIANVAERELEIAEKKNRRAVQDLAVSTSKMSESTGVNYRVMNDKDIRKAISEQMAREADDLEAKLGELPEAERAGAMARIEELRQGASDDYFYKGFYYTNAEGKTEILINSESPQAHQTVIGHETGHLIKTANAEEFEKLGAMLEKYAKKKGEYDAIAESLMRSYPEADDDVLREEITCELLGRYVYGKDDAFIKQIAGENPSIVRRIIDYLKELMGNTTDKEMSKELKAIIDKTQELVGKIDSTVKAETPKYALKKYPQKQLDNWANSKKIIIYENDDQLKKFVEDAKNGKIKDKKIYFGRIPESLANRVENELGINIHNKNVALHTNEVQKIFKDHGTEKTEFPRGQRPIEVDDFVNFKKVIEDPDDISLEGDYFGRPVIHFVKDIDGKTTVVTYDSDKTFDIRIQTAYTGKKKSLATATSEQADVNTPEATSGTALNDNIPQPVEFGKHSKESKPPQGGSFNGKPITAKSITDSSGKITKETDDAYMKAVDSGDEETQKKIIEATADHKLKDSKLRDENGDLIPMYHSTIGGKFTVFDKNRADPEGNSGAGFYFSSSKSDSNNNYATVEGADVSAKIERRANELEDEYDADPDGFIERYGEDIDDVDDIDFDDLAEKDLFVSSEEYNTYLDVKEPLYVGSNGTNRETDMLERLEARVDDNHESTTYREDYDDDIDFEADRDTERYMFTDEEIGSLADEVADDLNLQYGDYQRTVRDIASAINECYEDGRMTFDDLKEALWKQSEGFYSEEGENLVNEIARSVAEKLGYDGIVDYKVSTKFRGMGLKDGDFHTIVFKPEQIKTTEAITRDDAGNVIPPSERFNTSNQDMRFSKERKADGSKLSDLEARLKRVDDQLKKTGNKDRRAALQAEKSELEGYIEQERAKNVENSSDSWYNNGRGDVNGQETESATRGAENIRGTSEEVRGNGRSEGRTEANPTDSRAGDASISSERLGGNALTKEHEAALAKSGVKVGRVVDRSSEPEAFIEQLKANANSQKFGVAVDSDLKPEDLKGAKLYTASMGNVTIGIKPDGDIFALAKNTASNDPRAFEDAMFSAIANGGIKMDNYGSFLTNMYERFGFEPVAKIPFNPAYISDEAMPAFQEMIDRGIQPDVYVMKHNGDSLEEVGRKFANDEYKISTQEDLDKLPVYEDYDEALKYRDSLIENERAEKQWREENPQSAKMVDDEYVSDKVKTALKDIREANIYTSEAEKLAKQYNSSGRKIAALKKKIENSKTPEHIKKYEEELAELELKQKNLAGKIEQKGKMKAVDPDKTAKEQLADIRGSRETMKVNKEPKALVNENGRIKDSWTSLRRLFEDSFIAMETEAKRVMKEDKELGQRLLTQINRVRNDKNVFTEWITNRRSTFDNHLSGKALDDIFTPELRKNTEKYNDFQDYLLMKHVPARHEKGTDIWADVSPELAEKRVKELEDQYGDEIKDWAKEVYDYINDLQQYRVDSGLLTKEAMEQFAKDYPFYVPTNRVQDGEPVFFTKGNINNGVRTAKGGESEVMDIYNQLYTATNKTIHAAEENQMLNLYFKARGISEETLKGAELKDLEHAAIKAEVNNATNKATVSFFVDGKPVRLAVDHQVARGLREWDGLEYEKLMKAAKVATLYGRPFKALITDWNLAFGVRNGARDLQQALVNSKNTRYFTSSMPSAFHAITTKDNAYMKLYESMGGKYAQLVSFDDAGKPINIEKGAVDKILGGMDKFTDLKYNPIKYIEQINGGIELIPRLSEFIGTIRKDANDVLKKQGSSIKKLKEEITKEVETLAKDGEFKGDVTDEIERRLSNAIVDLVGKDTIDAAMRNANDITLNFGRSGVIGKALNMGFVPYFNPSIQGLSKLVRMFTENGIEGGGKALLNLGMKLSLITLAPAAANEWFLRDNEDYQNLNSRDKDNNFFIPWGDDGMFIKIPKPRENAVLAEPVEYGLRHFLDNAEYAYFDWSKLSLDTGNLFDRIPLTDEGKQSFRTAMDNIGIINPMDSNMISPLWQTIHNKTWYGGSIESAYDMEKKSNKRYDLTTSAVAIQLGQTAPAKFFNLSPKKIDNLLDSYTGMIYDLGISQTSEKAKSEGNWFTRTIASQFMKDSVFSNKLSTKAWAKVDGMSEEQQKKYKSTYMYDTFKYDDAMNLVTTDKSLTKAERAAIKRDLMRHKNMLNREAINGSENTVEPLSIIAKHLGANRTLNNFLPDVGDSKYKTWKDYYKAFKSAEGFKGMPAAKKERLAKKFLDVYSLGVQGQKKIDPAGYHDMPSWGMTGVAAAQLAKQNKLTTKEAKSIMMACDVYESQTETYFKYSKYGGNVNRFAVTQKNIEKTLGDVDKWGVDTGTGLWQSKYDKAKGIKGGVYSMSLATGKADFKDRAYYIANSGDPNMLIKMNAARGYSERYGHSTKGLVKLAKKADKDGNTYLKDDEIAAACNTIKKGKATSEEKAMAFVLLGGNPNKNPFGSIGDYSHKGDTGIQMDGEQKSGGGRRGHGHGGWGHGGGGGSSKGTPPKTESGAFKGKVTDPFATSNGTKASNLNDAYRKRLRKLNKIS